MKAIIASKRFDTTTASLIAEHWNGRGSSDLLYVVESLYRTKSGVWFLHGKGGAKTEYGVDYGNSRCDGETIVPKSPDEAAQWLEEHRECEALETWFADKIAEA